MISISTFKGNRRVARCQQNFKDSAVIPEIKENPEQYFYLLSKTEIQIFKQLCLQKQKYNIFRISQQVLAKWCRVSREYVNKVLKKFEAVGILKMWYHHKSTSHYRLSSFFTNQIIASLSHLWRAIPLMWLMSQPVIIACQPAPAAVPKKSSQYIKRTKLLNTKYLVHSNFRSKERDTKLQSNTQFLKKDMVMQANLSQLDFDYLKSIKPTLAGKVKLSAYPVEIVKQVDNQLSKMTKQISSRWSYFNQTCNVLCKKAGVEPNWSIMYKLSTQLGIPVVAPFYDDTFIPVKPIQRDGESQQSSRSRSSIDPHAHNMAIVKEYNSKMYNDIISGNVPVQPIDEAKEMRIKANKEMYRKILGLNEDGTFVNGSTPEKAIAILSSSSLFMDS